MKSYLPPWAAPGATAAVDQLATRVGDMTLPEVLASMRCIMLSVAHTATVIPATPPLIQQRLQQHVSMAYIAQRMLLDRAADLHAGLEETHDHCEGFLKLLADVEARIITVSGSGT